MEDAVKLNPNDVAIWNQRGWIALMCDEPERSIQSFEHGLALDPMTPRRGVYWNGMAFAYFILRQYDKGREFAEKSVELVADVHSLPALIANEVRSWPACGCSPASCTAHEPSSGASELRNRTICFHVRSPEFHRLLSDALREAGIPE